MTGDPCLRCTLPDCDERSPRCALRRLHQSYEFKRRRGEAHAASDAERQAGNAMFAIWLADAEADASEGRRAWPRRSQRHRKAT